MKFVFMLFVVFVFFSVPLHSSSVYYMTEEQKIELQNLSKEQKKQIENLNLQLMTQEILVNDLQNQLETVKNQLEESNNALTEAKKSSEKSKANELIYDSLLITVSFILGYFIGYGIATLPP